MEPTRFIPSQCSFVFAGACCISVCLLTTVFSFHVHLLAQNTVLWNIAIILNHLLSRTMNKGCKSKGDFFVHVCDEVSYLDTDLVTHCSWLSAQQFCQLPGNRTYDCGLIRE